MRDDNMEPTQQLDATQATVVQDGCPIGPTVIGESIMSHGVDTQALKNLLQGSGGPVTEWPNDDEMLGNNRFLVGFQRFEGLSSDRFGNTACQLILDSNTGNWHQRSKTDASVCKALVPCKRRRCGLCLRDCGNYLRLISVGNLNLPLGWR